MLQRQQKEFVIEQKIITSEDDVLPYRDKALIQKWTDLINSSLVSNNKVELRRTLDLVNAELTRNPNFARINTQEGVPAVAIFKEVLEKLERSLDDQGEAKVESSGQVVAPAEKPKEPQPPEKGSTPEQSVFNPELFFADLVASCQTFQELYSSLNHYFSTPAEKYPDPQSKVLRRWLDENCPNILLKLRSMGLETDPSAYQQNTFFREAQSVRRQTGHIPQVEDFDLDFLPPVAMPRIKNLLSEKIAGIIETSQRSLQTDVQSQNDNIRRLMGESDPSEFQRRATKIHNSIESQRKYEIASPWLEKAAIDDAFQQAEQNLTKIEAFQKRLIAAITSLDNTQLKAENIVETLSKEIILDNTPDDPELMSAFRTRIQMVVNRERLVRANAAEAQKRKEQEIVAMFQWEVGHWVQRDNRGWDLHGLPGEVTFAMNRVKDNERFNHPTFNYMRGGKILSEENTGVTIWCNNDVRDGLKRVLQPIVRESILSHYRENTDPYAREKDNSSSVPGRVAQDIHDLLVGVNAGFSGQDLPKEKYFNEAWFTRGVAIGQSLPKPQATA